MSETSARCTQCGREFFGMPKDGIDHYGVKRPDKNGYVICGGRVEWIAPTPAAPASTQPAEAVGASPEAQTSARR